MYAVIATGGKQYRVTEGDRIHIERVEGEPGQEVQFDHVLFVGNEDGSQADLPAPDKVAVVGKILEQGKGDKITVFKFKKRKMYRRKQGHRQQLTSVQIESVGAAAPKKAAKAAGKEKAAPEAEASASEAGEE